MNSSERAKMPGMEPCESNFVQLVEHNPIVGEVLQRAEDEIIRRCAEAFAGCGGVVEVRNEARVHLWYEAKFGVPCAPFLSAEGAIDCFAATACSVGMRSTGSDVTVYAPYGLDDLFSFTLRPNTVLAPRLVYETKAARWSQLWPRLTILPWPEPCASV